jgi:hypothetical protein
MGATAKRRACVVEMQLIRMSMAQIVSPDKGSRSLPH